MNSALNINTLTPQSSIDTLELLPHSHITTEDNHAHHLQTAFPTVIASSKKSQAPQADVLLAKLQEAYQVIKKERQDKQKILLLLKDKLAETKTLHFKINKMHENIKCCQEHISIERDNHQASKNKITYVVEKLQAAEQTIQQQNKTIQTLKAEHEESMRKTKLLIEEFYRYKFLEEITYADLDKISLQEIEPDAMPMKG